MRTLYPYNRPRRVRGLVFRYATVGTMDASVEPGSCIRCDISVQHAMRQRDLIRHDLLRVSQLTLFWRMREYLNRA